jgi:hypothetical protein
MSGETSTDVLSFPKKLLGGDKGSLL